MWVQVGPQWAQGLTLSKSAHEATCLPAIQRRPRRAGGLWERAEWHAHAGDRDESGHPQKGKPPARRQEVRPVSEMESSRSGGLWPQRSWLLLSPALVCLLRPGDLCAVFVRPCSRNEDEPRGEIP